MRRNSLPIYSLRVAEVFRQLETSPEGLPPGEAATRGELYGKNVLVETPQQRPLRRFLGNLRHPLAILLFGAGLLALVLWEPLLSLLIFALVLANAGFSFWREYSAERAIEALSHLLPDQCRVVRDGQELYLPAQDLVPGDVIILEEGDHISADARVVEEYGLRVNHSTLTGEAVPARKTADASLVDDISEIERPNLVFAGTSVVSGTGRAVVYATGMYTQFGRLAHLTEAARSESSPLQREMTVFTRRLEWFALGMGALVFIVSFLDLGLEWQKSLALSIGILAAIAPEGLPATITLTLAMTGQRLAQRGILVKKLSTIEALGNISLVCTDKSGTLTQNQMTVREVWQPGQAYQVSGAGYEPGGMFTPDPSGSAFQGDLSALLAAASACNNSRLCAPTPEHPYWTSLGDGTEAALRVAARKGGIDEAALMKSLPRLHELPFDARRKCMSTIHRPTPLKKKNGRHHDQGNPWSGLVAAHPNSDIAFTKGGPREVVQCCTHVLVSGEVRPLDTEMRGRILAANDQYARGALRVLAFAYKALPAPADAPGSAPRGDPGYASAATGQLFTAERIERGLVFLGLMAMMDPPRPEVAQAVGLLGQAGIRMVMITGDYGLTAESLARRVGMLSTPNPMILTGAELDQLEDFQLKALLKYEVVFARMAPEHKLRLVSAFQELGEVVAVTGDGVNDAPALRKADVGIVMGLIGTDVAKEAADVIITNDDFSAIPRAIEEGRSVYDNLRKFMTYIFSSNVPELVPFLMTAIFGIPLALLVQQILAIDLGTDLLPALALGAEKPEPDVMNRPPRRREAPLVDRSLLGRALWLGLIETVLCFGAFFAVYHYAGNIDFPALGSGLWKEVPALMAAAPTVVATLAVTVFHAGVVMAQVGNVFAVRTEKSRLRQMGIFSNPRLLLGIVFEILMILAMIYIPVLARWMGHAPLPAGYWAVLVLFAPVLYLLEWCRKIGLRKRSVREQGPVKSSHQPASKSPELRLAAPQAVVGTTRQKEEET